MTNFINIIKRAYFVFVAMWVITSVGFVLANAEPSEVILSLINALITIPVACYVFYRTVRYVSFGR